MIYSLVLEKNIENLKLTGGRIVINIVIGIMCLYSLKAGMLVELYLLLAILIIASIYLWFGFSIQVLLNLCSKRIIYFDDLGKLFAIDANSI